VDEERTDPPLVPFFGPLMGSRFRVTADGRLVEIERHVTGQGRVPVAPPRRLPRVKPPEETDR
jgi:hypothetical protein